MNLADIKQNRYLPGPRLVNRYMIRGTLTTKSPLHVGSGAASEGNTLKVQLDAHDRPVLPGSGLRGAIRSFLESYLVPFNAPGAWDVATLTNGDFDFQTGPTQAEINDEKGRLESVARQKFPNAGDEPASTAAARNFLDIGLTSFFRTRLDLVSGLFGHGQFAGRLEVGAAVLRQAGDSWRMESPGVSIDRNTGAASDKKLFVVEAVRPGVPFHVELTLHNVRYWEIGMVLAALRAFNDEFFPLRVGGHGGTDHGRMTWSLEEVHQIGDDDESRTAERLVEDWLTTGTPATRIGARKLPRIQDEAAFATQCIQAFADVVKGLVAHRQAAGKAGEVAGV